MEVNALMSSYIFVGPDGVLIEGVRKIHKWEQECIELSAERKIIVMGSRLRVEYKSMDSLLIKGEVSCISFLGRGGRKE